MAQFYADRVAIGSHRAKTPEGYLLCTDIPFARTGFQKYRENEIKEGGDSGKEVTVIRPHDEVLNPRTISSFEGKPITQLHPPNFVDPQNYSQYARGHVQNVHAGPKLADGEYSIVGDLLITDAALIDKIESNAIRELSAGYDVQYVPDPHDPQIYRQTNIRGNHIAVVPSGRAGSSVKILDSKETTSVAETAVQDDRVSLSMLKGLTDWLRGLRHTTDAESEAVERNERYNTEALARAKRRNFDAKEKEEEMEKEEEGMKKATDALNAGALAFNSAVASLVDAVKSLRTRDAEEEEYEEEKEEKKKGKDKRRSKDDKHEKDDDKRHGKDDKHEEDGKHEEDWEEEEKEEKKKEKDADLIPVETLSGNEVPKNPIPGADKALDHLRSIRSVIAKSGNRKAIDAYNDAVRTLKQSTTDDSTYSSLLDTKRPPEVENAEVVRFPGSAVDSNASENFVDLARQFHRRNVREASADLRAQKEKK